jgi:hypothetical protein
MPSLLVNSPLSLLTPLLKLLCPLRLGTPSNKPSSASDASLPLLRLLLLPFAPLL